MSQVNLFLKGWEENFEKTKISDLRLSQIYKKKKNKFTSAKFLEFFKKFHFFVFNFLPRNFERYFTLVSSD